MSGYKVLPLVSVAFTMAAVVCAGRADSGEAGQRHRERVG